MLSSIYISPHDLSPTPFSSAYVVLSFLPFYVLYMCSPHPPPHFCCQVAHPSPSDTLIVMPVTFAPAPATRGFWDPVRHDAAISPPVTLGRTSTASLDNDDLEVVSVPEPRLAHPEVCQLPLRKKSNQNNLFSTLNIKL